MWGGRREGEEKEHVTFETIGYVSLIYKRYQILQKHGVLVSCRG